MNDDSVLGKSPREKFDSGYTPDELGAIFDNLARGAKLDEIDTMGCALALGVSDGDVQALSDTGTVMLRTPRGEIDRRIAAVRARMADGATFLEAVDAVIR